MQDLELLHSLYNVHSPSGKEGPMIEFLKAQLIELGLTFIVDEWGNIYVQKGIACSYPCIVAHMDEVHTKRSKGYETMTLKNEIIIGYDKLARDYHGIGADDKNGIWVCLKALKEFDALKVVFFTEEETGGTGSMNCNIKFFRDCRFVLQCDRKGNSDFITDIYCTDLCSKKFIKDVNLKAYGYKEEIGMFTDVYNLKTRKLNISVCNISCGYYNPHTKTELTNIEDLNKCYTLVSHIIKDCTQVYQHTYVKKYATYRNSYDYFQNWGASTKWQDYYKRRYGDLYDDDDADVVNSSVVDYSGRYSDQGVYEEEDDFGAMVTGKQVVSK